MWILYTDNEDGVTCKKFEIEVFESLLIVTPDNIDENAIKHMYMYMLSSAAIHELGAINIFKTKLQVGR